MRKQKLLSIARAILSSPTAPFHEEQVANKISDLLKECPHVQLHRDAFGNLIAHYQRGKSKARYAFAAHMDHPGWVGNEFLGGVPKEYLDTAKTKNFGAFSMWDLPPYQIDGDLLFSRACDDLIGCAAIVATLQELEQTKAEANCYGLFTRAEEVGFVGAIKLAKSGFLKKGVTIVSLETSAERPPAKMGQGPILRVGDRTSIFDPEETTTLQCIGEDSKIAFQRCLMSGGTCEATAYQLYGYRCAALCIALGNYHNCGPHGKIASEYVSISDFKNLAEWCVAIAQSNTVTRNGAQLLRKKLEANLKKYAPYF